MGDEWEALKAMVSGGFGKKSTLGAFGAKGAARQSKDTERREEVAAVPSAVEAPPALPAKVNDAEALEDDDVIGPVPGDGLPRASVGNAGSQADRAGATDSDEDEDDDLEPIGFDSSELPVASEAVLRGHAKAVTALALDPAANRLLTGSADYTVRFWDFQGMDSSLRHFRSIEPAEGCLVRDLAWSVSGDSFLVATTSAQARLYDREGELLHEYVKGDQYLSDMRNTKGHIAALSTVRWHPFDKQLFVTAAADSTVRIWDIENKRKQKDVIVIKSKARSASGGGPGGLRTAITSAAYSPDGKSIACAAQDGSLRLYASAGPYINPSLIVEGANMMGSECGGLTWSLDNRTLLTRCNDDTMKLWDIRNFQKPLHNRSDLPAIAPEHNAVFSPDERIVVTGTASRKEGAGKLIFLRRDDFSLVRELDLVPGNSAIKVLWNPKINQVLASGGDGAVRVRYDDRLSFRGARLAVVRAAKKRAVDDIEYDGPIITPESVKDEEMALRKRRKAERAANPKANHRPEAPLTGQGRGGKVGVSMSEILYRSVMPRNEKAFEDAREAFLKHADEAEKNPMFIAKAYEKTQPNPVFDERLLEEEALFGKEVRRRGMILKPSDIDEQNKKK